MEHGLPRRVGLEPRWRDLPLLARVQQRRFGWLAGLAPPGRQERLRGFPRARVRLVAAWSVLALPPQLASLVPARLTGCLAAVDRHAVVRISPAGPAFRRRYLALSVLVGGPTLVVLVGATWSPFLLIARLSGRSWLRYVGAAVALGVPAAEVAGSSARIARATRGRVAPNAGSPALTSHSGTSNGRSPASRDSCASGPTVPETGRYVAGSLAAWPPGGHAGSRLLTALLEACEGITPLTVDFAAEPDVIDFYERFGFAPVDGHSGLMRYSA